ncbi:MAG: endolytic transglycosylase MltG [Saprospiraceae bacterium]|nr:endolytic transglycosylase MltG [Saprospiraceae bacterium]
MDKRLIIGGIFLAIAIAALVGFKQYKMYLLPNVPADLKEDIVNIPTGSDFEEVMAILVSQGILRDSAGISALGFRVVAKRMNYIKNPMRAGRFRVKPGWSNVSLIRHLRSGQQETVKVVLNSERLPEDVATVVSSFLEPDAQEFLAAFENTELLQKMGYKPETLIALFIPNTYDFFWNTTPEVFLERMQKENSRFWSQDNRLEKAKKLGLSPAEVYTLASIIGKETNQNSEKPRMAGVYLNRLKQGILLQADPTAVFATRDFTTRRVLNYHTNFDSPYNTYKYLGLPPGPISMASISSIDAVLNAENHDYIFFCALGDGSGLHAFAETLSGHNRNARIYKENLRKRGLR